MVSETVYAEFSGDRAGTDRLTWGQQAIWKAVVALAPHDNLLNVRRTLAVPQRSAPSATAAAAAIGALLSRHESLRTLVRSDGAGLCQQLSVSGRLPLPVIEADPDTVDDRTEELRCRLAEAPFDHPREWPVRAGLVVVGGRVSRVALVLSHVAVDAYAADIVLRELRTLLVKGALPGPPGRQPLDLARQQRDTPQRQWERAREHWLTAYRMIPAEPLAPAEPPAPGGRYHKALLTSQAAQTAVELIAARHRVSTSTVLLAATAALFPALTGQPVCGLLTSVHNRFQPGHAGIVSPMTQLGLFVLTVDSGATVDELVPRAWQAALTSYRHAYYDQAALDEALAASDRGGSTAGSVDPYCMFNDLRRIDAPGRPAEPGGPSASDGAAAARSELATSTLTWESMEQFNWRFYLEVQDGADGLGLAVGADSRYLPPAGIERFLRELAESLVATAFPH